MPPPAILSKNLLIEASAGSGKTYQLSNRVIGHILAGARPERIVALTFTLKAAGEFTEAVLRKFAEAAGNPASAERVLREIGLPAGDFSDALERIVRALPRLRFGTIDGFFARVVRSFQYELGLTGGRFELIEGPGAEAVTTEILTEILQTAAEEPLAAEFLLAFRRAHMGREKNSVLPPIREFTERWHETFLEHSEFRWGPDFPSVSAEEWPELRDEFVASARRHLAAEISETARVYKPLGAFIAKVGEHTTGSGIIAEAFAQALPKQVLASLASGETGTALELVFSKQSTTISGPFADCLRGCIATAAMAEMHSAIERTRAIHGMMRMYDARRSSLHRRRGRLSFHDVKILMGGWADSPGADLRRQEVDFRIDGATDHWLLDEFQDTSRADWRGLFPLVNEAVSREDASVFVVGDRKQAIYGWRGGDVGLFDELEANYSDDDTANPHRLRKFPMAESWRSCPAVLELVNKVCGNRAKISELFGETVGKRWRWDDHVSAPPKALPAHNGEARVVQLEKDEEPLERIIALLEEKEIASREISCGILLRSNKLVKEYAAALRAAGFSIIEDGTRHPAHDSIAGAVLHQLLRWLANPDDSMATGVLRMSPIGNLNANDGGGLFRFWEALTAEISREGFSGPIGKLAAGCEDAWTKYDERRIKDILEALAGLDAAGETSVIAAAEWIGRLKVSQPPGAGAIQVMTIHKSKGLGFDMVVIPEISSSPVPNAIDFTIAKTKNWILSPPPSWVRGLNPELRKCEEQWVSAQRYEELCALYVALTRAKRGIYAFLPQPPKDTETNPARLTNLFQDFSAADEELIFHTGDADWFRSFAMAETTTDGTAPPPRLSVPVFRRRRKRPSMLHSTSPAAAAMENRSGMSFGNEAHGFLERIGWLDETPAPSPSTPAENAAAALLAEPELLPFFHRSGRNVRLLREQPVDAIHDGSLVTGVIDRLHFHSDAAGNITHIEIIDFKTDAVDSAETLLARHRAQLESYRACLARMYPQAAIACALISLKLRVAVCF